MTGAIDRVVVPLDAAGENRTAIDTAARLAARAGAPLHGVFVEDEDLLHLASLPFARQVTLGAGAERFTTADAELALRVAAERAQAELRAAAKRHRVECSFEVVRGVAALALSGASARDLVVAGALTRPVAGDFRLACRWWPTIAAAPGPFLLARHAWRESGRVVLLLRERGAAAARLLATAAQLAEAGERNLTVICPQAVAGAKDFAKWLAEHLADRRVAVEVEVSPEEPSALVQLIGRLDCRVLAVEAGPAAGGGPLREFVEGFACDVLIVR